MAASNHKVGSPITVWQSLGNIFINQASNLKQWWDQVGEIVRLKHDALCDYIDTDIATKAEIQGITLGQVPNGSITTEKLDPNALQANLTKLSPTTANLHGKVNVDEVIAQLPFAKYYGKYSQMSGGSGHTGSAGSGLITFTTEDNDDFGVIDIPASATRITIPPELNGRKAKFYWYGRVNGGSGYVQTASAKLRKNGVDVFTLALVNQGNNSGSGSGQGVFSTVPITVVTGDYFEVYATAETNSGQNTSVSAGSMFGVEIIA